jgi:hypothetical protein
MAVADARHVRISNSSRVTRDPSVCGSVLPGQVRLRHTPLNPGGVSAKAQCSTLTDVVVARLERLQRHCSNLRSLAHSTRRLGVDTHELLLDASTRCERRICLRPPNRFDQNLIRLRKTARFKERLPEPG